MGKKRKMPGLNTSSTADISFMLLIFFLVTTSMDTDQGLARTLPKPPEDDQLNNEIKVKERNILNIRINKDNYVMIGDDYASLEDVAFLYLDFVVKLVIFRWLGQCTSQSLIGVHGCCYKEEDEQHE